MRIFLVVVWLVLLGVLFVLDWPQFKLDSDVANVAIKGLAQAMIIAFTYLISFDARSEHYAEVEKKVDSIIDVTNSISELSKRQSAKDDVRTLVSVLDYLHALTKSFANFIKPIADAPEVVGNDAARRVVDTQIRAYAATVQSVNDAIKSRVRDLQPRVGDEAAFRGILEEIEAANRIVEQFFSSTRGIETGHAPRVASLPSDPALAAPRLTADGEADERQ
ncbi:BAR domain-containing protein [Dongia rigui]|uniref:Uncharacterized protein n=1 Tax=Dongia rigui TaxID=940149 RepID=A0ABU5DWE4_9PROT|nr:hypothetical protein [Dongia rigui]MDY0871023.1 hypothetical protein [Dongia rigui]